MVKDTQQASPPPPHRQTLISVVFRMDVAFSLDIIKHISGQRHRNQFTAAAQH